MPPFERVVVIGLDGLEPRLVDELWAAGQLPHLARLRASAAARRVATTTPAQTPVAWSSALTGVNPGGHGIFDFVRRDPASYQPLPGLARHEQTSAFTPPRAVNLRRGAAVWDVLGRAGLPSVVLRSPCTYPPPESLRGRMLAGVGVPDLRGGLGTATFFTSDPGARAGEAEQLASLSWDGGREASLQLIGPRHPGTRRDLRLDARLALAADGRSATLHTDGQPRALGLRVGEWSDFLRVSFRLGWLQSLRGMFRFLLVRTSPHLELYASPLNYDPDAPPFPLSAPPDYAGELARVLGPFHTTGMVEDHHGVTNGRYDHGAFLDHCALAMREREAMLHHELDRLDAGLLFCLFDTPDRLQHLCWAEREPDHPSRRVGPAPPEGAIAHHYRECDALIGRVLDRIDPGTLLVVLSDHGMGSFRRGVHLNGWLREQGLLALASGTDESPELFAGVDWGRTRAYAIGLGGIYINQRGREGLGVVDPAEAESLAADIARGLRALTDPQDGASPIRAAHTRRELYRGPFSAESPDLTVDFAAGYRVSWATGMGGVPRGCFEDNTRPWAGDHLVDPTLVPGVLLANAPLAERPAHLQDLAPTILAALGVPPYPAMEGLSLLADP